MDARLVRAASEHILEEQSRFHSAPALRNPCQDHLPPVRIERCPDESLLAVSQEHARFIYNQKLSFLWGCAEEVSDSLDPLSHGFVTERVDLSQRPGRAAQAGARQIVSHGAEFDADWDPASLVQGARSGEQGLVVVHPICTKMPDARAWQGPFHLLLA